MRPHRYRGKVPRRNFEARLFCGSRGAAPPRRLAGGTPKKLSTPPIPGDRSHRTRTKREGATESRGRSRRTPTEEELRISTDGGGQKIVRLARRIYARIKIIPTRAAWPGRPVLPRLLIDGASRDRRGARKCPMSIEGRTGRPGRAARAGTTLRRAYTRLARRTIFFLTPLYSLNPNPIACVLRVTVGFTVQ